jgi:hypothetical protein
MVEWKCSSQKAAPDAGSYWRIQIRLEYFFIAFQEPELFGDNRVVLDYNFFDV